MLKRALPIIKWTYLIGLLMVALFFVLTADLSGLADLNVNASFLVLAVGTAVLWVWWQSSMWGEFLRDGSIKVDIDPALRNKFFSSAWISRYLPGKLPGLASLAYQGTKFGVSRQKSSLVAFSQTLILAFSMLLFAIPALWLLSDFPPWVVSGLIVAVVVSGALLFLVAKETFALRFLRWIWKKLTGKTLDDTQPFRRSTLVEMGARALFSSLILGLAQTFLLASIWPEMGLRLFIVSIVIANLAVISGVVAVFAPNGIGIREFVLYSTMAVLTAPEVAASWAVMGRLLTILADLTFWLIANVRRRG